MSDELAEKLAEVITEASDTQKRKISFIIYAGFYGLFFYKFNING